MPKINEEKTAARTASPKVKVKAPPAQPASKSAHDKLRSEFDEFKDKVSRSLGLDPNAD